MKGSKRIFWISLRSNLSYSLNIQNLKVHSSTKEVFNIQNQTRIVMGVKTEKVQKYVVQMNKNEIKQITQGFQKL
jgi:hypothetical protein